MFQSRIDVFFGMGERDGTLLGSKREVIHTSFNQLSTHPLIFFEMVMAREVVPVSGAVIHEIEAKGRTLS